MAPHWRADPHPGSIAHAAATGGWPRTMTASVLLDRNAIVETFRQWDEARQPLDAELSESLAALAAFQSHLEAWQQELAGEREKLRLQSEELNAERARLEREQGASQQDQAKLAELTAELHASRDKVGALSTSLLSRTEELRVLDMRRTELATELDLSRAREKELKVALDEIKQSREEERLQATEATATTENRPAERHVEKHADNPVLASVMEQFGKLRQQRAMDRPAFKKGR
jgi:chromosome segregation ATPase